MKQKINKTISAIPITFFLLTVAYNLVFSQFNIEEELEWLIYCYGNEISMIIMSSFVFLVCYRLKLCWYNRVSAFGLLILSIINIVAMATGLSNLTYYSITMSIITAFIGMLALILLIIRK